MVNKELLCFVLPYQRATCVVVPVNWLVSSGNLSALDVNGSEAREIAGEILSPLETRKVARGNTTSPKTPSPELRRALLN